MKDSNIIERMQLFSGIQLEPNGVVVQALVLQARRVLPVRQGRIPKGGKGHGVHPYQGLLSQAQQGLVLAHGTHHLFC